MTYDRAQVAAILAALADDTPLGGEPPVLVGDVLAAAATTAPQTGARR